MPDIGYTGTPDEDMDLADFVWCTPLFTMPVDGTFTTVSAWLMSPTLGATIRVYDASGNALATSAEIVGPGTPGFVAASISLSRTSGQQLRLAIIAAAGQRVGRTTGFPGDQQASDVGGVVYPTWPADPFAQNYAESGRLAVFATYTAGGEAPTITSLSDATLTHGQTSVTITGTGFGASQGGGRVIVSPTDNPADGAAVNQTVTSWGDTSITFTAVLSALAFGTLYLFVENNDDEVNVDGEPISRIVASATLNFTGSNNFKNKDGTAAASKTGMTFYIWRAPRPPSSGGTPDQIITGVSTNAAGERSQSINLGSLDSDDTVYGNLFGADGNDIYWTGEVLPDYA